ncbi:hypothetical protein OHS18_13430 [Amycolatopsis sp. NBC_00355]|uniref:DUF7715 family protein n=1 Tax=Amycolatopsis sp. NBC_00355 TaxID=2975957 RepID=UPI002E26CC7A
MLKYFVSTHRTQGERDNDSNSIPDTEIVDLASLSHTDPDNSYCGCARSFVGIHSRQTTTTAEIAETDLTPVQFVRRFYDAFVAMGFPSSAELHADAANAATELLRLAAMWPVGTVVERRCHEIRVRSFPNET